MFGAEAIVVSIASAVLKNCAMSLAPALFGPAFHIYTAFEVAHAISECKELDVCGARVGYEVLADKAIEHLVKEVGGDCFACSQRPNGLYVAGNKVAPEGLLLPSVQEWSKNGYNFTFDRNFERKFDFGFEYNFRFRF